MLFAPNPTLIDLLARGTHRAVYSMKRGVDAALFTPERRDQAKREFTIGYVGRLTVEKNVGFLVELEHALDESGFLDFRFSVVGQGAEEQWLRSRMRKVDFKGVLKGEALARAYANMDLFVFPSRTDTFGNAVLEALASGVPAMVTDAGGPQFIIQSGENGFVAQDSDDFVFHIRNLARQPKRLQTMRQVARAYALNVSWERIFGGMYEDYAKELRKSAMKPKNVGIRREPTVASSRLT